MSTKEDFEKMKVAELKTACKDLGLDVGGVKADLVARLHNALASSSEEKETTPVDTSLPAAETEAEAVATAADALPVEQVPAVDAAETPAVEVSHSKHPKILFIGKPSTAAGAPKVAAVVVPKPVVVKVVAAEVVKPEAAGGLTEAERKQQRAERFKSTTLASTPAAASSAVEDVSGKMKDRAARFHLAVPESEKFAMRAEKFSTAKPAAAEVEKSNKRAAKFAPTPTLMSAEEEAKKKARSERFKTAGDSVATPAAAVAVAAAVPAVVMTPEMVEHEAKKQARLVKFAPPPLTA